MRAMEPKLRKATMGDIPHLHRLVNEYASAGEMLPRSVNELYESLRDFFVVEAQGQLVACGACHITWDNLAEIRTMAVARDWQGRGLGGQIVQACLEEAKALGIGQVFVLTYRPEFFARQGFREVDKATLPHKIWTECINCPKFPDCGEVALIRSVE